MTLPPETSGDFTWWVRTLEWYSEGENPSRKRNVQVKFVSKPGPSHRTKHGQGVPTHSKGLGASVGPSRVSPSSATPSRGSPGSDPSSVSLSEVTPRLGRVSGPPNLPHKPLRCWSGAAVPRNESETSGRLPEKVLS